MKPTFSGGRGLGHGSALLAAALFGASFPLAKGLLSTVDPVALAGMFYLASGLGLGIVRAAISVTGERTRREAPLAWKDRGWLAAAILSGGVGAPIVALMGLNRTPAHVASLLSGTETLFTILLAILFFGDFLGRKEIAGVGGILAGAALVALGGSERGGALQWQGPLLVLGSAFLWGLDNNFTQRLSDRDPLQIASVKGIAAGIVNLGIAAVSGTPIPLKAGTLGPAAGVGFLCYGVSLTLFVIGLRGLGAARTSALFATAPLFGVVLSWAIRGETPTLLAAAGGLLMIPGAWLLIRAEHHHWHVHEPMEHEHRHVHDEHHRHEHRGDEGPEPHSHPHRHERLEHEHEHSADLHHRHDHA